MSQPNSGADGVAESAEYLVDGLGHPVEIIVDRWGVPHLYASTVDDVFVAQGFNAARDRLFQIDLWRRRGLGRLAEVFGPDYVEQDRANRLFCYRGDMEPEWSAYGPDTRAIVEAFVTGINAYVDWVSDHPEALPPEFTRLDYRPARWSPEDVLRVRSHGIAFNLRNEVSRAKTAGLTELAHDRIRRRLEPDHRPVLPQGLDPHLPEDILGVYDLATGGVTFTGDPDHPIRTEAQPHEMGSNNWAIAGHRTVTGRPILAGDPHRAYATPSLRYLAHLSAPGLDVIGAGEPAIPGVALGHNGSVAFAFTIFPIDTEDLYVYELDPGDYGRYRYLDGWERFVVGSETVAVRGEESRTVELAFSRHGPVIYVDADRHRAYGVRTTWHEPGTAAYAGSLGYLRAGDATEFAAATGRCGAPGENHVYADVHGVIGWKPAGLVPRRVGWDGLLPVPGDGRCEWDGFYAPDELPGEHAPEVGFWSTANEFNLPPDYPRDRQISYEWPDPARQQRIVECLTANPELSVPDSARLQVDLVSVAAREVVAALAGIDSGDPTEKAALRLLTDWDAEETADSAAAALYEVWMVRHLRPAYVRAMVPGAAGAVMGSADPAVVRAALRDPETGFGPGGRQARDHLVRDTLRAAYEEVSALLGPDPSAWRWGDLHQNLQPHVLGGREPGLDVGPFPVGGSGTTVNAASYRPRDFRQTGGASFRMVLDVGEWDNSVATSTPGQSGDPRSPHYRDLADGWRRAEYFPLLYSRSAIERAATARIRLVPGDHG